MQTNVLTSTNELSRNEWLSYRNHGLGGSDAAYRLWSPSRKSPMSVWLHKEDLGECEELGDSAYWGSIMKSIIRDEFTRETGIVFIWSAQSFNVPSTLTC